MRRTFATLLLAAVATTGSSCAGREARDVVALATWNLEWLAAPETTLAARRDCAAGRRAALPCDVAVEGARGSADFARLARAARALDADVIAFQEVADAAVAARVFRRHAFCLGAAGGVQRTGFAVRRGLPFRCDPPLRELALGGRLRDGAILVLFPDTPREVTLLSVHLKSGCVRQPLDASAPACRQLRAQASVLARWIAAQAAAGRRFGLLGDFNRDLLGAPGAPDALWLQLAAAETRGLVNAATRQPFRSCVPGQPYSRYIDHVLVAGLRVAPGSFERPPFPAAAARRYRLSDHCPVRVQVLLPGRRSRK